MPRRRARRWRATLRCAALALLLCRPAGLAGAPGDELAGVWSNPHDSVHVELRHCGAGMCGRVTWASERAREKARAAGTDPLVGTELLREFTRTGDGRWRGRVFVPDLGKTVAGSLALVDNDTLRARSCALELFCKTQVWKRIG